MPRHDPGDKVDTTSLSSYGGTVVRGSLHTGMSQVVTFGCQILSVIVLSRLLAPGDFGIVAMVGPVIAFLALFKEMGLLQAVIQKEDLTYGQVSTLFWLNVAVSGVFTVLLVLAAPLIAAFYGEPELTWIVRITAMNLILTSLGSQHFALLNRGMMFGRLAINAGAVAVITLSVSILWALVDPSPWALVAGTVAGSVAGALMVWFWLPWRPVLPAIAPGTRDLLGFGAGVTGFKLANFFSRNLDNILIGRFWGGEALGFYDRAYKLLLFPLARVADPLSRVMVPVLSRMQKEPERYAAAFFRVFGLMQLALLPGVAAITAMSDTAVPFLLGEKWAASAPIFAALGIAGMVQPSANPTGWLFISQGRTTEMAWWGLASAVVTCTAFAVGVRYGVFELAAAYTATSLLKLIPLWWLVTRKGPVGRRFIASHILPSLIAAFAVYAILLSVQQALPGPAPIRLLLGAALAYLAFASLIALTAQGRAVIAEGLGLVRKGLTKIRS